jgi:hypothetical protein
MAACMSAAKSTIEQTGSGAMTRKKMHSTMLSTEVWGFNENPGWVR